MGKVEKRDTQSCRDLPQGIRRTEQTHRLAAQRRCMQVANISKRTLQHYRDTGVLPFTQIGHKCYYRREDVERLLQTKSEKTKTDRLKNNK